jgi:hypothetical protein
VQEKVCFDGFPSLICAEQVTEVCFVSDYANGFALRLQVFQEVFCLVGGVIIDNDDFEFFFGKGRF